MRSLPYMSILVLLAFTASCSPSGPDADSSADATLVDARPTGDVAAADSDAGADVGTDSGPSCVPLFGSPGPRTGLADGVCGPSCGCDAITAREPGTDEVSGWLDWTLETPFEELSEDPYEVGTSILDSSSFCVLAFDEANGTYSTQTTAERPTDGAVLTHGGACGVCSTLQDLVAYVRNPDLTDPVRECGLLGVREGEEANIACLEDLGFSRPCAQIWYFNTRNTRMACLAECFAALNEPYHLEDGALNPCLACDEEVSGPVFKSVAGRTRRNSGLASAICRSCDSVTAVTHEYPSR